MRSDELLTDQRAHHATRQPDQSLDVGDGILVHEPRRRNRCQARELLRAGALRSARLGALRGPSFSCCLPPRLALSADIRSMTLPDEARCGVADNEICLPSTFFCIDASTRALTSSTYRDGSNL